MIYILPKMTKMNTFQDTISENTLAEYIALMRYTSAWRDLDLKLLETVFTPDVIFDAPGIPYDIVGLEQVISAHKMFFENLQEMDSRLNDSNKEGSNLSCHNVITQIYPYENNGVYPFMQLSFFTEHSFLKLYYFFVDVDVSVSKILRIKTHSTKFLVDTSSYHSYVQQINSINGLTYTKSK